MRTESIATGLMALMLSAALLAGPDETTADWPEIEGAKTPAANRMISGQPSPAELVRIRESGVTHVVNARDIGEFEAWDQAELIETLGMTYHRVPIGDTDDLDLEAVRSFDRILSDIGDERALLHCASGNRIGALFALRAAWLQGRNTEEAIDIGQAHGLTGLSSTVRRLLDAED
jgi:uncharacterized protein (TIGR01244 family)